MQRIWHHDRTINDGGNCEISYVWYDGTNFNYEYSYYEHSPSICVLPTFTMNTVFLCLQQCHHIRTHEWCMYRYGWVILLFRYSSCTFPCSTVAQDSIVRDLAGEWTWSSHLILFIPLHLTSTLLKLHSKLCFGSKILRWLIYLFMSKKRKFDPGLGLLIKVPDGVHITMRCVSGGEHDHCLHMKYHHAWSDEGAESGNSANENASASAMTSSSSSSMIPPDTTVTRATATTTTKTTGSGADGVQEAEAGSCDGSASKVARTLKLVIELRRPQRQLM